MCIRDSFSIIELTLLTQWLLIFLIIITLLLYIRKMLIYLDFRGETDIIDISIHILLNWSLQHLFKFFQVPRYLLPLFGLSDYILSDKNVSWFFFLILWLLKVELAEQLIVRGSVLRSLFDICRLRFWRLCFLPKESLLQARPLFLLFFHDDLSEQWFIVHKAHRRGFRMAFGGWEGCSYLRDWKISKEVVEIWAFEVSKV